MILALLGWRGIAGVAVALVLSTLLVIQKVETRHWKKESAAFERLYHEEQSAFSATEANYRAAAAQARAADEANVARALAQQSAINERTSNDYEARLAAARADYQRLRLHAQAAADSGSGRGASVPVLPPPASGAAQAAGQDRLPPPDALTATEQAIQLDELIKWIRQQHAVRADGAPKEDPRATQQ